MNKTEEKKGLVVELPNRQICNVEQSEEIEGYLVVKRYKSVSFEVIDKSTGKTKIELTQYIHFTTREELVEKIKELDKA